MRKTVNQTHIEGLLYEHDLKLKVSGPTSKHPGTEFINGTISIATDNDCSNIVQVHFSYTTEKTAKGNINSSFTVLKNIIDHNYKSVMEDSKEEAIALRIDSAIGLHEFYSDQTGKEELVSKKRNEGGFVHVVNTLTEDEKARNTFKCDMLITQARRIEADEETNTSEKMILHGAIFDFRGAILPAEFSVTNPRAMDYFESLEISQKNPTFTKIWGQQISEVVIKTFTEESAFGEALVREVPNSHKDFLVTGASKVPYVWDSEEDLTAAEMAEKMGDRETYLAALKQRQEEYQASKNNASTSPAPAATGFNF